ncbi:MAG: hypothetical protein EXS59_01470 [Candidatus Taylorbacteria bacterium]|nr:hypothetical protein [Candidatus Taylorbacteria bacterium]
MTTVGTTVRDLPGVVVIYINLGPPATISGRVLSQRNSFTPVSGNRDVGSKPGSSSASTMTDDGDTTSGSN